MLARDYANALQRSSPLTGSSRRGCTLRPRTLALALSGAFALGALAQTLPTGGAAIHGQAQITQTAPNQLLVTTGNGAGTRHSAIDWQSFSLAAGASARFVQPDAASLSINRVVTQTPSTLLGTLSSNGRLVLVNPSGITVGAGAVVDTTGFTASALRMSDADALAGRLRFGAATPGQGAGGGLTVDGRILARDGDVVLIAPQIGIGADALLQSANGSTILAAGQQVEITGRGLEGISLLVQAREDTARNLGRLEGDAVAIFAGTLQHSGAIQASSATLEGGKVVLRAAGDAVVDGGSVLASGRHGGRIDLLGQRVGVTGQALVDTSGEQAGGSVRIGGDFQGKNAALPNAERTFLGPETTVRADARSAGDGGRIIVWSDDQTQSWGRISARGGEAGGNGGFVEVSGKHALAFGSVVDTRAPHGLMGSVLLDPDTIDIDATGTSYAGGVLFGDAPSTVTLAASTIGAALSNVVLQANADITFNAPVTMLTNGVGITARAGRYLTVQSGAPITTRGGAVTLIAGDPASLTSPSEGALYVQDAIDTTAGGAVPAGANVTLRSYQSDVGGSSLQLMANVNAGNGVLTLDVIGQQRIEQFAGVLQAAVLSASADGEIDLYQAGNAITSDVSLITNLATGSSSLVQFRNSAASFNLNNAVAKGNVTIVAAGAMTTDGVIQSSTGNVSITSNGALNFGDDVSAAGTLSLLSNNGTISQSGGALTVAGAATVNAGSGDVVLNSVLNDLSSLSLSGGNVHVRDANALTLSTLTQVANRNLTLQAGGLLTLPGSAINTGTGNLTLVSGQFLTTPAALSGNSVTLSAATGMDLIGPIAASSNFVASTSGGASTVTVRDSVSSGGTMNLTLAGNLSVLAGSSAAQLLATGNQTISANGILLQAGSAGQNLKASIVGQSNQSITVGNGGLTLIGGSGAQSGNSANLAHDGAAGTSQSITVNGTGFISAQGGSSSAVGAGENSRASIRSDHGDSQSIIFTGGGGGRTIALTGGTVGNDNYAELYAGTGAQSISGASTITLTGGASGGGVSDPVDGHGNNAGIVTDFGSQTIAANAMVLQGGATGINNFAAIAAGGNQALTVGAGGLSLTGGGGGSGALKNAAIIFHTADTAGTSQTITVNGGGSVTLQGGSSSASNVGSDANLLGLQNGATATIRGDGVAQLIEFTGAGSALTMTGGTVGSNNMALIAATAGSQTLRGDIGAHAPTITLTGGASGGVTNEGNRAVIASELGNQSIGAAALSLAGGAGGIENLAQIRQGRVGGGLASTQTITIGDGGATTLQGGGGNTNLARIQAYGTTQTLNLGSGGTLDLIGGTGAGTNIARLEAINGDQWVTGSADIHLTGGASGGGAGVGNFADMRQRNAAKLQTVSAGTLTLTGGAAGTENAAVIRGDGSQSVTATGIALTGGASGTDNLAQINAISSNQLIDVGAGGLSLTGGGGISTDLRNYASVFQGGTSGISQTIHVGGGGNITLQGGHGAAFNAISDNSSFAYITNQGDSQLIEFTGAGSSIAIAGGSVGSQNGAGIVARNGSQTVRGDLLAHAPSISMLGGSGGAADQGNGAQIAANLATQTISAKAVSLNAGSGIDSFATITAPIQSLTIDGNLSLAGGSGSGSNPGARIGGRGGAAGSNTDLTLTVSGNATLSAGTSAGAGLGSTSLATGLGNTISATIGGTLTITPSAGAGTRIGSRASDVQGGTITLTAGNMVFNAGDGANNVAAIRTLGNVTLNTTTAGITEAADTVIRANQLTVNAKGPVLMDSLGNQATSLQTTITGADAGDLFYTSAPGSLLTLAGLSMSGSKTARISADDLNISGAVTNPGGTVILRPQALVRAVQIEATPTAGVLSLQPAELGSVSAATLEIGRLDGSGDLSVLSSLGSAQIGAGTLRLLSGANVAIGYGVGIGNGGTAFDHALEVHAANDLTMADNSGIYLADNRALALTADHDASSVGAVSMGDVAIQVGTGSGNTSGNMLISGASVSVQTSGGLGTLISVSGSGTQTFTSTAGDLTLHNANGSTGSLVVSTLGGAQTLTAAGQILVQAGTGNGTFTNVSSGGNQSISASGMSILAGSSSSTSGNAAYVRTNASQSVTLGSSGLQLIAGSGTGTTDHTAQLYQAGGAGTNQTITITGGGSLTMQGGSSTLTNVGGAGHGSRALIEADGDSQQLSLAGGGHILLTGGSAGSRAYAQVYAKTGTQAISGASGITLNAGNSGGIAGEGNTAGLTTDLGSQSIDTSAISMSSGAAGTENLTQIRQGLSANAGTQTITIRNGGAIQMNGGGGTSNLARIQSYGASQTLDFTGGGTLTMTGGTGASNDYARIQAVNGNQTIQGEPAITINGGASGGADLAGNSADIRANLAGATQTIHASSITLNAGASGQENYAYIGAGNQVIDVQGNLLLNGGGSAPSADGTSGGGSRIGAPGTAATNLTLTVGGDLILNGGAAPAAGVAIGGGRLNSANTTISITAGGDIQFNPGSSTSAGGHIGSSASATGGGDIDLTAGGWITLGGTVAGELAIRTLGNVSLDAHDLSIGNLVAGARVTGIAANAITLAGVGKVQAGATSGDAIVLATGGGFSNGAGASALQVNAPARWLVYSQDPAQDTRGALVAAFKQYGKAYGDATPLAGSGNGFLYSYAPSASLSLTGAVSKVYDGTDTATLSAANFLASGAIDGDVFTFGGLASGHYDTRNVGSGKTVSVSGLSISAMNGSTPVYGYAIAGGSASGPVGTITAAPLTVSTASVSKTYDGSSSAPGAAPLITVGTLAAGDTLVGGTFAFLDANAGSGKTVTVSGVTVNDGNGGNNYQLTLANDTGSSIAQRALSTWTGSAGDHLWSSAGNWDVLPSAANVLAVSIPSGAGTVALDMPVNLQGINSGSPLSQVAGGSLHSSALSLVTQGGVSFSGSGNQIAQLSAANSGSGDITLVNGVPLVLGSVQNSSGNITLTNTGALSSNGPVVASGNVALTALSPLTVGAPGVSAGGNVVLTAGNLSAPGPTDNLILNGPVTAGNTVGLYAGNNLVQNAAVFGANGVTAQALGSFSFGPLATTNAPPISYSAGGVPVAPPPTVLASSLQAPGDVVANSLGVLQDVLADVQGDDALAFNPDGSKKKKIADGVVAEEEVCR